MHGRESLDADDGSYQIQLFLHYVDANGPYVETDKYDRRPNIGIKETTMERVYGYDRREDRTSLPGSYIFPIIKELGNE